MTQFTVASLSKDDQRRKMSKTSENEPSEKGSLVEEIATQCSAFNPQATVFSPASNMPQLAQRHDGSPCETPYPTYAPTANRNRMAYPPGQPGIPVVPPIAHPAGRQGHAFNLRVALLGPYSSRPPPPLMSLPTVAQVTPVHATGHLHPGLPRPVETAPSETSIQPLFPPESRVGGGLNAHLMQQALQSAMTPQQLAKAMQMPTNKAPSSGRTDPANTHKPPSTGSQESDKTIVPTKPQRPLSPVPNIPVDVPNRPVHPLPPKPTFPPPAAPGSMVGVPGHHHVSQNAAPATPTRATRVHPILVTPTRPSMDQSSHSGDYYNTQGSASRVYGPHYVRIDQGPEPSSADVFPSDGPPPLPHQRGVTTMRRRKSLHFPPPQQATPQVDNIAAWPTPAEAVQASDRPSPSAVPSQPATPLEQHATVYIQQTTPIIHRATPQAQQSTPLMQRTTPFAQPSTPLTHATTPRFQQSEDQNTPSPPLRYDAARESLILDVNGMVIPVAPYDTPARQADIANVLGQTGPPPRMGSLTIIRQPQVDTFLDHPEQQAIIDQATPPQQQRDPTVFAQAGRQPPEQQPNVYHTAHAHQQNVLPGFAQTQRHPNVYKARHAQERNVRRSFVQAHRQPTIYNVAHSQERSVPPSFVQAQQQFSGYHATPTQQHYGGNVYSAPSRARQPSGERHVTSSREQHMANLIAMLEHSNMTNQYGPALLIEPPRERNIPSMSPNAILHRASADSAMPDPRQLSPEQESGARYGLRMAGIGFGQDWEPPSPGGLYDWETPRPFRVRPSETGWEWAQRDGWLRPEGDD